MPNSAAVNTYLTGSVFLKDLVDPTAFNSVNRNQTIMDSWLLYVRYMLTFPRLVCSQSTTDGAYTEMTNWLA